MASSLFQNQPNQKTNNSIFNKFNDFTHRYTPQEAMNEVQRLRTSGQMSEQQYQMLSLIANQIGGKK